MGMTMTEKAAKLKISQYYLSMIYNGKRYPGYKLVQRLQEALGKKYDMDFWRSAKLSQVQQLIDRI